MQSPASGLLTDLYQSNMIQAYLDVGKTDTAVFQFFVRKLPTVRLVAAGLEQALDSRKLAVFGRATFLAGCKRSVQYEIDRPRSA
jgi:nicotinic acid phosphoribosyltransferase